MKRIIQSLIIALGIMVAFSIGVIGIAYMFYNHPYISTTLFLFAIMLGIARDIYESFDN